MSQLNLILTLKMFYAKYNYSYSKQKKTNLLVKGLKMEFICKNANSANFIYC